MFAYMHTAKEKKSRGNDDGKKLHIEEEKCVYFKLNDFMCLAAHATTKKWET